MTKSHSLLLTSLLLAISMPIHAQEDLNREILTENNSFIQHAAAHFSPFTGMVSGSKVRMRVQPNLDGHVVRETTSGEMFIVMGETNDFYAITPPKEARGYVFRTFILDGTVEGERVNVRLYPDIDAPVIGQLNTGDHVNFVVSDVNSKWLEIALPENSRFYIAKEYIENKGPPSLLATVEKKRAEAAHHLSAASLFAQSEIQKPFEQIDLDRIHEKYAQIAREYHDFPTLVEQVHESASLMQEIYVQKKVAFLEAKANLAPVRSEIQPEYLERLAKLGIEIQPRLSVNPEEKVLHSLPAPVSEFIEGEVTDKMLIWQPLEEAFYHMWAAANEEKSVEQFYHEEEEAAILLTGIVEPYSRPVKNRPGDFLLRREGMPVAFLYSTKINLDKLVGQKVALLAAPRPNHNFAFPAYFVIGVD